MQKWGSFYGYPPRRKPWKLYLLFVLLLWLLAGSMEYWVLRAPRGF